MISLWEPRDVTWLDDVLVNIYDVTDVSDLFLVTDHPFGLCSHDLVNRQLFRQNFVYAENLSLRIIQKMIVSFLHVYHLFVWAVGTSYVSPDEEAAPGDISVPGIQVEEEEEERCLSLDEMSLIQDCTKILPYTLSPRRVVSHSALSSPLTLFPGLPDGPRFRALTDPASCSVQDWTVEAFGMRNLHYEDGNAGSLKAGWSPRLSGSSGTTEALTCGAYSSSLSLASSILDGSLTGSGDLFRGSEGGPDLGGLGLALSLTDSDNGDVEESGMDTLIQSLLADGIENVHLSPSEQGTPIRLGAGTFGQVYCGYYREQSAAIKIKTKPDQEIMMLKALQTQSRIVSLYHTLSVDNIEVLVMEKCVCSLRDVITLSRTPGLPDRAVRYTFREAYLAVTSLTKMNIVHLDIKPDNFLVTGQGNIKLCDFGVSQTLHPDGRRVQLTGLSPGTEGYRAPEVILGSEVGSEADFFSLAVTVYELYTARLPWRRANDICLLECLETTGITYPDHVTEAARDILNQMLTYFSEVELSEDTRSPSDIKTFLLETGRMKG